MNWKTLAEKVLAGGNATREEALAVLESPDDDLLVLLDAAFAVRRRFFGRGVALHVIQNAQSGLCSEDCAYCSQSSAAEGSIERYRLQSVGEIVQGAHAAHRLDALRYCVVISGRAPPDKTVEKICEAVRQIKREVPLQICTSLGLLDKDQARQLKQAGVDRYNHNLETSERFFDSICTTHTYADRVATARVVKAAGMELCSGGLLGMGETFQDRVDLAFALREAGADSIPVNFLDPRPGTPLAGRQRLSPSDCLRALILFRLVNSDREIRMAGGREACLGPMQVLGLFAANSMFTNGYLTTPGQGLAADRVMIESAGFQVTSITQA
ncbi:MAG: biotin synthase BioB [Verrucomicrobia bacterium]|nr:biotin synthase BioB [Verrucomicrobiota bacterium]MCG2681000.1 biotin synthase BioB [Kiritimatiellia bacterium]MBU4247780.1 biotin synthase BioB [Verrucomicrobiota bacterium]MBU4292068.1 biotin synthase BioB [Verrucomicrobiota bacterium]MBU4427859.1 biotin synthase BioB [Verrucomicrobiota bacterium]